VYRTHAPQSSVDLIVSFFFNYDTNYIELALGFKGKQKRKKKKHIHLNVTFESFG